MNKRRVLKEGRSLNRQPNQLDPSKEGHRRAEQARRAEIRNLQEQISVFFLVPGQKKVSVGELLLFGKCAKSKQKTAIYLLLCPSRCLSEDRQTCIPGAGHAAPC